MQNGRDAPPSQKEWEDLYEILFHSHPQGMIVSELEEGRYLEVNQAYEKILGYSRDEVVGRTSIERGIWSLQERDRFRRLITEFGRIDNAEFLFRHKSGSLKRLLVSASPVRFRGREHILTILQEPVYEKTPEPISGDEACRRNMADFSCNCEYWMNPQGELLYLSPACELLTGYMIRDFLDDPELIHKIVHPEDRPVFDAHHKCRMGSQPCTVEFRILTKENEEKWINHVCVPVYDRSGRWTGNRAGNRDITEKKRIEESLRKSEQKFKAVFQGAIEAIYIHDQKGRFIDANPQAYQRLGYSKDELLTMTPVDIDIQAEKVEVRIEKLNREGFLSFETEFVRKDGSRFPVEVNSLVIEYGGRQAVLAFVRDISKRKRAENALREARNLFQSLVETTSDWIWEVDENFRYVYASPKITDILGYQPEEVLGKPPFDLMPRDEAARLKPLFEEIQGSCQPFKGLENRNVRKDGTEVILETSGVPFHKPDGKGCGFRGIDRDITERKQMEQSLWELNRDLENRVRRRTRELEQANNAKNEFLANMSHEIRTPLSGILGMAELSLTREIPDHIRENLEMIRYSALSLSTIINDLLDFSALEAGRLSIRLEEFSLREEIAKLTSGFEDRARSQGLSFEKRIDADVPERVATDQSRVRQILINLLNNALKFTKSGSITLSVQRPDHNHLSFAVADTGIGIPAHGIQRIFQSFTQLEATRNKRFSGTGLGLAISRNLAELMGGKIDVQSEPGKGSVFTLTLPMESPEGKKRENARGLSLDELPPLRILLAEDNPVNQFVLTRVLKDHGHKVSAVGNGRQVLDLLSHEQFDLILMDVQMPEMDGMSATRAIRQGASGINPDSIPIIALTAYAMKGDREKFLAVGMNGYVSKPVDFQELARAISEACALTGVP